ncbi:Zinc finger MYND domain-containing protein 10 [Elasticomyces elasticus]|nr:Zinc finger MYND domain-containing protein 10 [Elasticomyces elasticus]
MATTVPKQCGFCGNTANTECARCNNTTYCDVECQQKDWTMHKTLCDQCPLSDDARPTAHHRRAIHPPVDGDRPKLVWLDTALSGFCSFMDYKEDLVQMGILVDAERSGGQHLDHEIMVCHSETMQFDGFGENKVLSVLTDGKVKGFWKGSLLIWGRHGDVDEEDVDRAHDIHVCDLGLAVQGLMRIEKDWMP